MVTSIIYFIGGLIETLVGLRFVFRLIGASGANGIVSWVYSMSTPFVTPFSGILGQDATVVNGVGTATTSVFDWPALIALIVIGLIVGLIGSLVGRRSTV